jgi:hypothetical protein
MRSHARATTQTSAIRNGTTNPTMSTVVLPAGAYRLKPNGCRRTNTARVSPLTQPPPAYTANHDDADGVRAVQRERRGPDETLPTYQESLDPETVPGYNADANNNDVEAGVGQQVAERPRVMVDVKGKGGQQVVFVLAAVLGVFIYLGISHWSH